MLSVASTKPIITWQHAIESYLEGGGARPKLGKKGIFGKLVGIEGNGGSLGIVG